MRFLDVFIGICDVTLMLWLLAGLVVLGFLCWWAYRANKSLIKKHELADKHYEKIKMLTQTKFNKIATLGPDELTKYLSRIFKVQLVMAINEDYTDKDYQAIEKLYAGTLSRILKYIGPDTESAINYYYGSNYLIRWCENYFIELKNNGQLAKMISNPEIQIPIVEEKHAVDS